MVYIEAEVHAEPSADSSLIGQTFDNKFRIIRLIGRGGMGEVFEAEHTQLGKRVAVKLMLEKYMGDREAVARFTREALAAGRIGSPHIIDVMDIGTAPDGRAYVVMELLHGQPLAKLIEDHGQLPLNRALKIMRQVLRAVGAAHLKGIVHRDLKPDNIFLTTNGEQQDFVKLLDFGISKIMDPELAAAATKLTTTGVVMGTPLYMAPEQAMGNEIDHLADLYACGVIFYEMLAGKPPFEGHTYAVLVAKLLTTDAQLLGEVREGLPPKLIAAIHKALEKEPKARHAHADAFLLALPATQSGSPIELAGTVASGAHAAAPAVPSPPASKRTVALATIAALVGVAVASVVVVKLTSGGEAAPAAPAVAQPTKPTLTPITLPTRLDLAVTPADAVVILDGQRDRAYRNGEGIVVVPGEHRMRVELAGYVAQDVTATVAEGETKTVTIALAPVVVTEEPKPRPLVRKPPPTTVRTTGSAAAGPVKPPVIDDLPPPPPPIKKEPAVKKEPTVVEPDRKPNPY